MCKKPYCIQRAFLRQTPLANLEPLEFKRYPAPQQTIIRNHENFTWSACEGVLSVWGPHKVEKIATRPNEGDAPSVTVTPCSRSQVNNCRKTWHYIRHKLSLRGMFFQQAPTIKEILCHEHVVSQHRFLTSLGAYCSRLQGHSVANRLMLHLFGALTINGITAPWFLDWKNVGIVYRNRYCLQYRLNNTKYQWHLETDHRCSPILAR